MTTPPPESPSPPPPEPSPTEATPWGSAIAANAAANSPSAPPPASSPPAPPAFGASAPTYPSAEAPFGGGDSGGSSKLPWVLAALTAVVLLGGGVFFALSAFGASGGASSPDEGIEAVLGAVGDEDFVTLAELMEPAERRTLAEPAITDVLPELVRLGLLDDSVDAGDIEGVDLVFTDVEYRVERLVGVDDIAHVFLTGGEFASNVNGALLPFTDEIDTADLDQQDRQTITESDTPIVFVERDGGWFFSLWFTIAENARIAADERLPSPGESPAQIPSDSPEAAIEGMFNSMTEFDLTSFVGHMDPEEMAVLYRYSPLFLDDAQAMLDDSRGDLRDEGITWEMSNFDFDVDQSGDDAVVAMRGFTLDFATDGFEISANYALDALTGELEFDGVTASFDGTTTDVSIDGQIDGSAFEVIIGIEPTENRVAGTLGIEGDSFEGEIALDPSGDCSRYEITGTDGTNESGCLEEDLGIDGFGPILVAMEDWPDDFPGVSMRARQVDGGWFVSPVGSILGGIVTGLEGLEEGNFDDVFNPFASVIGDALADPFGVVEDGTDFIDPGSADFLDDDVFDDDVFDDDVIGSFADPVLEDASFIMVSDGESVEFLGAIEPNGFDSYEIELDAGSELAVTALATDGILDTTLRVADRDGSQLAFNDDAGITAELPNQFDSQLVFTAPDDGFYQIEVAGFNASSAGEYTLIVDRSGAGIAGGQLEDELGAPNDDIVTGAAIDIAVASGETLVVNGVVEGPTPYNIDLELGDELVITVESDDVDELDPIVSLMLDGFQIGRNDDALDASAVADSFDSQLIINSAGTATHVILVEGFGGTSGAFTMTIERN